MFARASLRFRSKRMPVLVLVLVALAAGGRCVQAFAMESAKALVQQAAEAQGGEQKLRAIASVQWEAAGYRNELEESERPEGPYITDFLTIREVHDYSRRRYRNQTETAVYPVYKVNSVTVVDGEVAMRSAGGAPLPGTPQQVQLAREKMALSPERLLLTALDASDLRRDDDQILQSVMQNVVSFTLDGAPVRIFLNSYTHLPTAVDYSGPLARAGFWAFLGDATQRTYYNCWWLAKGGIHFPMQMNVEGNGLLDQVVILKKLQLDGAVADGDVAIPPEVRAKFDPKAPARDLERIPLGEGKEIAPGILFFPGPWNTTVVKQDDGLVMLEAPISSGYSAQVMEAARKHFPGEAIKAVITTSDSWPHLAGIREYAAQGVPIYAVDLNQPILERVIAAPHSQNPDRQQRHPRTPEFKPVHGKLVLGSGTNKLELYPLRGETSERQMMVYFPGLRLLYGSDPFQKQPDGSYFYPQTVTELVDAVQREHLDVDRFFMMHIDVTPWSDLAKAIAAAERENSPTGVL